MAASPAASSAPPPPAGASKAGGPVASWPLDAKAVVALDGTAGLDFSRRNTLKRIDDSTVAYIAGNAVYLTSEQTSPCTAA